MQKHMCVSVCVPHTHGNMRAFSMSFKGTAAAAYLNSFTKAALFKIKLDLVLG